MNSHWSGLLFSFLTVERYIHSNRELSNLEQARGCRISEGLAKGVLVEDSLVPALLHNQAAEAPVWDSLGPADRHTPEAPPGASHTVGRSAEEDVPWRTPAVPRNPSVP